MIKSKPNTKLIHKQCLCCKSWFYGIFNKKYCDDTKCVEIRLNKKKNKKRKVYNNKNLLLNSKFKNIFKNGQNIRLRCRAKSDNQRCKNIYNIIYSNKQIAYPMYCEEHRNEYKRMLFEKGKYA